MYSIVRFSSILFFHLILFNVFNEFGRFYGSRLLYSGFSQDLLIIQEQELENERLMNWSHSYLERFSKENSDFLSSKRRQGRKRFSLVIQFAMIRPIPYMKIPLAKLLESLVARRDLWQQVEIVLLAIPATVRRDQATTEDSTQQQQQQQQGVDTLAFIEQCNLPIRVVHATQRYDDELRTARYLGDYVDTLSAGAATNASYVLVFEDDVDLVDDFVGKLETVTRFVEESTAKRKLDWGLVKLFYTERFCGFSGSDWATIVMVACVLLLSLPVGYAEAQFVGLRDAAASRSTRLAWTLAASSLTATLLLYMMFTLGKPRFLAAYPHGLSRTNVNCCSQAHLFNSKYVTLLIDGLRKHPITNATDVLHDVLIAQWMSQHNIAKLQFTPHLAQHIGIASTLQNQWKRVLISASFQRNQSIAPFLIDRLDYTQTC